MMYRIICVTSRLAVLRDRFKRPTVREDAQFEQLKDKDLPAIQNRSQPARNLLLTSGASCERILAEAEIQFKFSVKFKISLKFQSLITQEDMATGPNLSQRQGTGRRMGRAELQAQGVQQSKKKRENRGKIQRAEGKHGFNLGI